MQRKEIVMVDNWFETPEGIKEMFESHNKFDELKSALLNDGIIYEYDCDKLVTSQFIEHSKSSLDKLFKDYEDYNSRKYIDIAHEVDGEGWMYCLFDSNIYNFDEVKQLIEERFSKDY